MQLPTIFQTLSLDEMKLVLTDVYAFGYIEHIIAEVLHLRAQRDSLQASNTALLERARAAEAKVATSTEAPAPSMMFCEHANECPNVCPCDDACACRQGMCKVLRLSNDPAFIAARQATPCPREPQCGLAEYHSYDKCKVPVATHDASAAYAAIKREAMYSVLNAMRQHGFTDAFMCVAACAAAEGVLRDIGVTGEAPCMAFGRDADGSYTILNAQGDPLFTAKGCLGTKHDVRALVYASRALAKVQDRLEHVGASEKRLRHVLTNWQQAARVPTWDALTDMLRELGITLGALKGETLVNAAKRQARSLATHVAMVKRNDATIKGLQADLMRLQAVKSPALQEQVRDLEAKRAAWESRALAAEKALCKACDTLDEQCAVPIDAGEDVAARILVLNNHANEIAKRPQVGVAVLVRRAEDGALLMMRRKGSHGAGTWSVPGGRLERDETVAECAARELAEEAGIRAAASRMRPVGWTYTDMGDGGVWLTLYMLLDHPVDGDACRLMEPEKCSAMRWVPRDEERPAPLFEPNNVALANGIDIWNVEPTHPMLGAAVRKIGVVDQQAFVDGNVWRTSVQR